MRPNRLSARLTRSRISEMALRRGNGPAIGGTRWLIGRPRTSGARDYTGFLSLILFFRTCLTAIYLPDRTPAIVGSVAIVAFVDWVAVRGRRRDPPFPTFFRFFVLSYGHDRGGAPKNATGRGRSARFPISRFPIYRKVASQGGSGIPGRKSEVLTDGALLPRQHQRSTWRRPSLHRRQAAINSFFRFFRSFVDHERGGGGDADARDGCAQNCARESPKRPNSSHVNQSRADG
jgi:hypothetical protein